MSGQQWKDVVGPVEVTPGSVSICFVFFRGMNLEHLDAAWYSLSKQDLAHVNAVYFLDNNTTYSVKEISTVLWRYPFWKPGQLFSTYDKHDNPLRTQSWSVNTVCQQAAGPWVFFTRADYILAFDALARMRAEILDRPTWDQRRFVSGWCWQMAYDREAKNIDANIDIEQYGWRERGMPALLEHPYAFRFHETDQDAGVWFTAKDYLAEAGWMNEKLTSWGYQQSTFQRALRNNGITCSALPDYLFAHQHHYAVRDFDKARREYEQFGEGR